MVHINAEITLKFTREVGADQWIPRSSMGFFFKVCSADGAGNFVLTTHVKNESSANRK